MNSAEELVHCVLNLKSLNYKVTLKTSAGSSREVNHVISCLDRQYRAPEMQLSFYSLMCIRTNTIISSVGTNVCNRNKINLSIA